MKNNNYIIYDLNTSTYKINEDKLRNLFKTFAEFKMKLDDIIKNINNEEERIMDQIKGYKADLIINPLGNLKDVMTSLDLLINERNKLESFMQPYIKLLINFEPLFLTLFKQFEEMENQ